MLVPIHSEYQELVARLELSQSIQLLINAQTGQIRCYFTSPVIRLYVQVELVEGAQRNYQRKSAVIPHIYCIRKDRGEMRGTQHVPRIRHAWVSADRRNLEPRERTPRALESPRCEAIVKAVPDLRTESDYPQNKLRSL